MTNQYSGKKLLLLSAAILFFVLLLDQAVKIWVKTHFLLGESVPVFGNWFYIHFTENYGMAFGMEFGGGIGKLFLSLFRILASAGIGWYIVKLAREKAHPLMIVSFSLILAGAVGNIIDSVLYGRIFSDSAEGMATMFPANGGYAPLLHGRVVDMLYFPLFSGVFPSWVPIWGGEPFLFFRPVFNIADSSITIGVLIYLLFNNKMHPAKTEIAVQEETSHHQ